MANKVITYPMTLSDKDREWLREHIDDFYRIFVIEDVDLQVSVCSCCENRREFMKRFLDGQ